MSTQRGWIPTWATPGVSHEHASRAAAGAESGTGSGGVGLLERTDGPAAAVEDPRVAEVPDDPSDGLGAGGGGAAQASEPRRVNWSVAEPEFLAWLDSGVTLAQLQASGLMLPAVDQVELTTRREGDQRTLFEGED
jgi:hypothetical protein